MKRLLLIFLILSCNLANAFEIVYPKTDNVTINSDKTFFIGNEKEGFLKINDNEVKIHKSGGFKQPVNLEVGENIFVIDNGKTKKNIQNYATRKNTIQRTSNCRLRITCYFKNCN